MRINRLRGKHVLVINWRDVYHPQAGGAEQYMHEIARRWIADGVRVTWLTARASGAPRQEVIDGISVVRLGGELTVYFHVALWLMVHGRRFAAIIDCQNGIPFFAPLWTRWRLPVIQVVHHVHQDQFTTRFSPPMAAVGRFLEGRAARAVYGRRAIAAVSPSTREELRTRLALRGPVFVVPNGTSPRPQWSGLRAVVPTIVVVTRLVPHKRLDLLLGQLKTVARRIPSLQVDVIGDGPALPGLYRLAAELGLSDFVTFHGRQPDQIRDELLQRAWLTTSTSIGEGWGCSVLEAAAWGVPCAALNVPGVRDAVVDGETGWLFDEPRSYGDELTEVLRQLADEEVAKRIAERCQAWAHCFTWERSAELLAGVVNCEIDATRSSCAGVREPRTARPDITTIVHCADTSAAIGEGQLRATDQVMTVDGRTSLLLGGCDELDAAAVVRRLGGTATEIRLADRYDLLVGPRRPPMLWATLQVQPSAESG
jgi:glycosyltransferase involved in cell wall biosynthesis